MRQGFVIFGTVAFFIAAFTLSPSGPHVEAAAPTDEVVKAAVKDVAAPENAMPKASLAEKPIRIILPSPYERFSR